MTTLFKYVGRGDALYHVPARDLTDQDLAERQELWKENGITEAVLLGSGLYEKVEEKPKSGRKAAKDGE